MYPYELIEVVCALHLAHLVDAPYEERGGLFLVGPPGALKSTFLAELDRHYPDALTLTDLNAKTLAALRDRIASGTVRTLVFPEYQKIYERKDDTAANLEGAIRALVAEGFTAAAFEEQQMNRLRARACVIGAITPATQLKRFEKWEESGFNRRFLWSLIRLDNPAVLDQAVENWSRVKFRVRHVPQPPPMGETIPNATTREERARLRAMVKYQPGGSTVQHVQSLTRILAVLRWWYGETGDRRNPMQTIERFAWSLGREGARVELEPMSRHQVYRQQRREKQPKRTKGRRR